jgi:hypothetical protein
MQIVEALDMIEHVGARIVFGSIDTSADALGLDLR